ncbi:SRPBCC family protein [Nocardioides jejuensis]|uniref:SRPBCC family protein n=1 Tax=Nocardioides jejuensis TaxID=2502782 RepID=A0A4R1CB72_9ACTN|nr:SRPBCC family protein [Nocardioides jejuensis]TCJ28323.1 SRPBCC family protein [Nocardioides jejuensis]
MADVTIDLDINASATDVFNYISDYTKCSSYIYGLQHLQPLTELTRGKGAKFEGRVKMGASLESCVEVTEFEEGVHYATQSFKGVKNGMDWTVSPVDDGNAKVRLIWTFDFGSGIAGRTIGKLVEPFIKIAAKQSAEDLKNGIEAGA